MSCSRNPCTSLPRALLHVHCPVLSLFDRTQLKSPAINNSISVCSSKSIIPVLKNSSHSALFVDPDGVYKFRNPMWPYFAIIPLPDGIRHTLCSGNSTLDRIAVSLAEVPIFI